MREKAGFAGEQTARSPELASAEPRAPATDAASAETARREEHQPPRKRKKKSTLRLLLDLLLKLALIAAATWAVLSFVVGVTIHYGNNMYPAIRDGDLVIAYRLQKPYLNAAVLYRRGDRLCMGRVVAMPGSEVYISEGGALTVNGIMPAEEVFYPTIRAEGGAISYPYAVGEGEVFILNDFRSDTNDSRSFGAVELDDVLGPALLTMRRRGF